MAHSHPGEEASEEEERSERGGIFNSDDAILCVVSQSTGDAYAEQSRAEQTVEIENSSLPFVSSPMEWKLNTQKSFDEPTKRVINGSFYCP